MLCFTMYLRVPMEPALSASMFTATQSTRKQQKKEKETGGKGNAIDQRCFTTKVPANYGFPISFLLKMSVAEEAYTKTDDSPRKGPSPSSVRYRQRRRGSIPVSRKSEVERTIPPRKYLNSYATWVFSCSARLNSDVCTCSEANRKRATFKYCEQKRDCDHQLKYVCSSKCKVVIMITMS